MKKLIIGENDLLSTNPEVAKEWNYKKNGDLKPNIVLPGSSKKVWWICGKGHEYEALIKDKTKGKKCPYCSNIKLLAGFNDLLTVNPSLSKEWNYDKNGQLKPEQVKFNANKKVWWRCAAGHEWEAYVFNRSKGVGCPYCKNVKTLAGENDLLTMNPEIAKEWNYEKNNIKPSDVTSGSNKLVWWRCEEGHEWKASIKSRTNGEKCPYCSNKKVLFGYNDLYTYSVKENRLDLINEFDNEKNALSLEDITPGSKKKVWWKCPNGHSYQATAYRRVNGSGCGVCSHNILLKNVNDLLTTNPEIAKEWDYKKNAKTPDEVMAGSNNKKYWFICPKGHSYETTLLNRKKGTGCPICAMEKHTSFPEKAIYYYLKQCIDETKENYRDAGLGSKEIDIYIPSIKLGIEYDGVAWHKDYARDLAKDNECSRLGISLIRIREKGCKDYKSNALKISIEPYDMKELNNAIRSVFNFIINHYQMVNMPDIDVDRDRMLVLEQMNLSEKDNSIAIMCPEIKRFWDYKRNGKIIPEQIPHASNKKVFLKCELGHQWEVVVSNFKAHPWCPYCSGRRVLKGFNDLFTTNPELEALWSDKNTIDPTTVKSGCNSKALWICPECGGEYDMSINDKTNSQGCPYCSGHRVLKGFNDLASCAPEIAIDWDYKKNAPLKPDEVTKGSNKRVWWKCHKCSYEWDSKVYNRGILKRGCPVCRKKK